jgi:hypothetical protein
MDFYFAHISYTEIRKDVRILASVKDIPNQIVVITSRDINADAIHEKRLRVGKISFKQLQDMGYVAEDTNPYRSAYRTFQKNEVIRSVADRVFSGKSILESRVFRGTDRSLTPSIPESITGKEFQKDRTSVSKTSERSLPSAPTPGTVTIRSASPDLKPRFRDWNPDVKFAHRNGMTIRYSSRTNEIFCPDLGVSSRGVIPTTAGKIRVGSVDSRISFRESSFSTNWMSDTYSVSDSSSNSSTSSSKVSGVSSGKKKKN